MQDYAALCTIFNYRLLKYNANYEYAVSRISARDTNILIKALPLAHKPGARIKFGE